MAEAAHGQAALDILRVVIDSSLEGYRAILQLHDATPYYTST
jgi:hypothetical protein